jgi:hypothetical protein
MCLSRNTRRNYAAPTRSQMTMNARSHIQARNHQIRQGYQSARYSADHTTTSNATETCNNYAKCYWSVPAPIDSNATCRIIGGNTNGLKPHGDMAALVTVAVRLLALQGNYSVFRYKCGMAQVSTS